eukprot:3019217-Rhodomonas_salina.1
MQIPAVRFARYSQIAIHISDTDCPLLQNEIRGTAFRYANMRAETARYYSCNEWEKHAERTFDLMEHM